MTRDQEPLLPELELEAPSAEVAEARRREFVAEVNSRPGFDAVLAEVARLDRDAIEEEIASARATMPRSATAHADSATVALQLPGKGKTLKRGLRAPATKTVPSLRAMMAQRSETEEDRARTNEASAGEARSTRIAWAIGAIVLLAGLTYVLWMWRTEPESDPKVALTPTASVKLPAEVTAPSPVSAAPATTTAEPTAIPEHSTSSATTAPSSKPPIRSTASVQSTASSTAVPVPTSAKSSSTAPNTTASSHMPLFRPETP